MVSGEGQSTRRPVLEGKLEAGAGEKLLMKLFAEAITGRVVVDALTVSGVLRALDSQPPGAPVGTPARGVAAPGSSAGGFWGPGATTNSGAVETSVSRTIFLVRGEPVHAEPAGGAAALIARLPEYKGPPIRGSVRSGVAALARSGAVSPVRLLEALRDLGRDATRALIHATSGAFELYVDAQPRDDIPLVAVSPFGMLVDAARRSIEPDRLLRLGEDIAPLVPEPRPGLDAVGPRIRSFTGGINLARVVDGRRNAADIYQRMGLPPIVGGLVLSTLAKTGVLDLVSPPEQPGRKLPTPARGVGGGSDETGRYGSGAGKRVVTAGGAFDTPARAVAGVGAGGGAPDPDVTNPELELTSLTAPKGPLTMSEDAMPLAELSRLPRPGGTDLLALYLELKPERDVAALFGAEVRGHPGTLERAYESRLAQIDPRVIGDGPARPYLLARVEELRDKLEKAYRMVSPGGAHGGGAYVLLERIGRGGMADVFKARATEDGRIVAVKRILPEKRDDADFARNLLDEARLARRVRHPNVVRVLTAGKSGDELYLAMEYVDGPDLSAALKAYRRVHGAAPVDVIARIVADACGGLQAAHAAHDDNGVPTPILHRDVSTQNILVSFRGEVKLTDFGIARVVGPDTVDDVPGPLRGKLPYLAPELVLDGEASVRSDVYAMGMTLYAALAKTPFSRESPFDTLQAITSAELPPLSRLRGSGDVPEEIDMIALKASARDPLQRYASAQELQIELEQYLSRRPAVDVAAWVNTASPQREEGVPLAGDDTTRTVPIVSV